MTHSPPEKRACKKYLALLGGCYLFFSVGAEAQSPSFDCAKARAPDEIVICTTPQLAELDHLVAAGYAFLKSTRGRQAADEVGIPLWGLRKACGSDPSCIRQRQVEAIIVYHAAGAPVFPPQWTSQDRSSPQPVATPGLGLYKVNGLALGGAVYPDSAVYKSYSCRPSDDFTGFTWCSAHYDKESKCGPYSSWVTILHSSANKAEFITEAIIPACFLPGDVEREIERLSRGFGQAQILYAEPRPGTPHAVLAAWGAVTLTPLDEAAVDALRRGEEIHRGLTAEFIGDAHKSARIGLPVYSIGGGPGYLWGASFDDSGKGSLRISAVDASALGPIQSAPPSPSTPPPSTPPPQEPKTQAPQEAAPAQPPPPAPEPPPAAPALKAMDVIDFLVDWKSLIGQTVTVTGCLLQQAGDRIVVCSAGSQGSFFIDGNTLAREDLRRALRECAGFEKGDECRVDVTGNVSGDSWGAELTNAAMKWAATLAAPQSPQSAAPSLEAPPTSPPRAENETSGAMPMAEKAVIDAVEQARHEYASASNEMQEGSARPARAKSICAAIPDRQARQWVGNVSEVSSNSEGRGVLNIEIASGVQVRSWNNALSDSLDNTLIDPSSGLYRQALILSVGQAVRFSGKFVSSSVDCIEESSLTLHGSVAEPDFIIRFSEVSPLAPSDSACTAVTDPNERLTCFYKTAVGGAASGMPAQRVNTAPKASQALPGEGKDCSGVPPEKRTLDCTLQ